MAALQNAIDAAATAERSIQLKAFKDIIGQIKMYADLALKILNTLAKYFFDNGKLSPPAIWKVWVYFKLVKELYYIFKTYKN